VNDALGPEPDAAAAGSIHQLVLLYWPAHTRAAASALLRVRAEVRASLRPGLDHTVAHTRLAWWQDELARTLQGSAAHPYTRQLQQALADDPAGPPDLTALAHAVALELARVPLEEPDARRTWSRADTGTLFAVGARLLRAPSHQALLRDVGAGLQQLQWLAPRSGHADERVAVAAELRQQFALLPAQLQPRLRPLLVWVHLAALRSRQYPDLLPDDDVSVWRGIAQNIAAWSAARAADRSHFRLSA
jgi:phytoene synthase